MVLAMYDYGPGPIGTIIGILITLGIAWLLRRGRCQRVCEGYTCWKVCPDNPPADGYIGYSHIHTDRWE